MSNHIVPIAYFAYWIILIAITLLILGYWTFRPRISPSASASKLLAGVLLLLVILLFAINQLPVLHTHFDVMAGEFVAGYHEPLTHGFIRFGYKLVITILLLSYAFSGVRKHH